MHSLQSFPPIGDAAYRQHGRGALSHGRRQHAQKFGKDRACGSGDILSHRETDRQTDIHTHHKTSQPLPWGSKYINFLAQTEIYRVTLTVRFDHGMSHTTVRHILPLDHGDPHLRTMIKSKQDKNSTGDEIANVNFYAVRPEATRIR